MRLINRLKPATLWLTLLLMLPAAHVALGAEQATRSSNGTTEQGSETRESESGRETNEDAASSERIESIAVHRIRQLIVTLESPTARQQFVENLRTLIEVEDDENFTFSLSETLDISDTSSSLLGSYIRLINRLGLDGNLVGKGILITAVTLSCLIFVLLNNWISRALEKPLAGVRERYGLSRNRLGLLFTGQRLAGYLAALVVFTYTVYSIITSSDGQVVFPSWGTNVAESIAVFLLLLLIVIGSWELINAGLEYGMKTVSSVDKSRVDTLLPVARNFLFFIVSILFVMVLLAELGLDIWPILAGAGVLGIAVGFGAQTLVKDFLIGFTIVLEDLIQVGDVARLADKVGLVEKITLRKIQLRGLDGTVYTVPHSDISVVENLTKEYSYYLMDIGVGYSENTDKVIECLKSVDDDIQNNDKLKDKILEPLEILGVDKLDDSAVVIRARIKTQPHDKWLVGREYNKRIKQAFDDSNIEIPFPHRTLYFANTLHSESDAVNPARDS
ncbi:MAG: mechanosensitive ion channel family protein [Gammaproteobacteria bacterium]